jgi:hypothetical protein
MSLAVLVEYGVEVGVKGLGDGKRVKDESMSA